jgi:hypothetical protein
MLNKNRNKNQNIIKIINNEKEVEKEIGILRNINLLPNEIKEHIKLYIPFEYMYNLNKEDYINNHNIIRMRLEKNDKNYEDYIRNIINRDNDFIFEIILKLNENKWIQMKNYYYKSGLYKNYIIFLLYYSDQYNSIKCKNIINNYLIKLGLKRNQYKNRLVRYIWIQ